VFVDSAYLAIDAIEHHYAGTAVLHGVTLHAGRGEILCLLGRSGCGKTTLLRLIAGLERPSAGSIALSGTQLTSAAAFLPPEKRGIGFMFQDYALFPHLTVLENTTFGLKKNDAQGIVTAKALLAKVGLETHADRYPHTLSAGEQQRAALVRALAPRPAILLMDEPFSNLDARTRDGVRDMTLTLLRETQTPAIIVTHDPSEAMRIGDRIALMQAGRLVQVGAPEEIYRRPTSLYAARYFSDLNEFEATCRNGRVTTPFGDFPAPELNEGPAIVGVRPHDMSVMSTGAGLQARVTAVAYLGDSTQITLQTDALTTPLKAILKGAPHFTPGQDVRIACAPEDVLFFPNDSK
jgi:iron(III) transport system ATP-binding protein